jgi:glycosyltransferase involved in cell wall biosynthesis
MVCSNWAKEVVMNNVNKFDQSDIHVIPLGVDATVFRPCTLPNKRSTTVFLNCGKWEIRKGHDIIVECFNRAFTYHDDVELWMLCDNPFIGEQNNEWKSLYKNSQLGEKIRIIPRQQTQKDVYNIMRLSDCGIFPSRAEGWNLELLEMMSCGKHVITTNYSAHTEFCNNQNTMLIDIDNLETAFDGVFFDGKCGFWAELSDNQKEETISHMRLVHKKKQNGELNINVDGIQTAEKFSWQNSAKGILNATRL